jgi:hypothetical protein
MKGRSAEFSDPTLAGVSTTAAAAASFAMGVNVAKRLVNHGANRLLIAGWVGGGAP